MIVVLYIMILDSNNNCMIITRHCVVGPSYVNCISVLRAHQIAVTSIIMIRENDSNSNNTDITE